MAIKLPETFGEVDVLSAVSRKDVRIGFSRFGTRPRNYFLGRAVPWKGLRKTPSESTKDYLTRLAKVNPEVAAGLKAAIKMSVDEANKHTGVVLVEVRGVRKAMPRFSYELGMSGKNSKDFNLIAAYESAAAIPPSMLMA